MSEAELHVLRARLEGGKRSKARRGELRMMLPVGLVYDLQKRVVLDPDKDVQQAIKALFQVYQRTGSATAVVKYFREKGLLFPYRVHSGSQKGQVVWRSLGHDRVLKTLHSPRYAGAYVYGRLRFYKTADGKMHSRVLPQDQWHTLILSAHPGYITWQQYQDNLKQLQSCAQAYGSERKKSPAGYGPALLQGLVVCGICGARMTVRYRCCKDRLSPYYICQRYGIENAQKVCQTIPGAGIDQAIGALLLETVTPVALEVALAVQHEMQSRLDQADQLRNQQVERAQYEADLAAQRFMQVDPNNRHVADALEADWNAKLRMLSEAKEIYEQQRQSDRLIFNEDSKTKILSLATDFPGLWNNPGTSDHDRKRMIRLLIEDVTLIKNDNIVAQVRFKGGTARTLTLPKPLPAPLLRKTSSDLVSQIDQLLDHYTERQIATKLDSLGYKTGTGMKLTHLKVHFIQRLYKLKSRYDRLRHSGMLTQTEIADMLEISPQTVIKWRKAGLLRGYQYSNKNEYLYEPPGPNPPSKSLGQKLSERRIFNEVDSDQDNEVQYEA